MEVDPNRAQTVLGSGIYIYLTRSEFCRLSPPSQKSPPHELKAGMEVLIGTIRFLAHERTTLTEEPISDRDDHDGLQDTK